jgi:hypothetical protein
MILTDDEIRKAAEFAAEQMWPESGYVGWTEDDAVFHRKFIEACLEKLRAGVELPEADVRIYRGFATHSTKQLLAYGAAQRLAGRERETCTWTESGDSEMPGTYASSCGEMWSFIDGGVKENRVTYCHHCGGKVVLAASPQEQQP